MLNVFESLIYGGCMSVFICMHIELEESIDALEYSNVIFRDPV